MHRLADKEPLTPAARGTVRVLARAALVLAVLSGTACSGRIWVLPRTGAVGASPAATPGTPAVAVIPDTIGPEPAPAPSDSAGIARLQRLMQVWHVASLYHSAVIERGAPWDSAFVRTATAVRATGDAQQLAAAYRRMLSVLHDPLTRVEVATTEDDAGVSLRPGFERTGDSVTIVRVPLGSAQRALLTDSLATSVRARMRTAGARVILDLRAAGAPTLLPIDDVDRFAAAAALAVPLNSTPIRAAGVRVRRIGGSRTAVDGGVDARARDTLLVPDDAWIVRDGVLVPPGVVTARRVMVLANRATVLPRGILSLVAAGHATLLAEEGIDEVALAPSVLVPIADGVQLRLRTGDVVNSDGSIGVVADSVLPRAGTASDSAPVLRAALALLRTNRSVRASRTMIPARMAPLPSYYASDPYPFMGARLLAGARLWSAIRVRHVHRDLYDEDLDALFEQTIPRLESARSAQEYAAALMPLVSGLADVPSALVGASADSVRGIASTPFRARWIEDRAIITDIVGDSVTQALGIEVGTEITAADGFPMAAWIADHRTSVSATNSWVRTRLLMALMPRGPSGGALFRMRDATNRERQLNVPRRASYLSALPVVERPLATAVRALAGDIVYVDVQRLSPDSIAATLNRARGSRALMLDLRGPINAEQRERVLAGVQAAAGDVVSAREVRRYESEPCLALTLREARVRCPQMRDIRSRTIVVDTGMRFSGTVAVLIDERTEGEAERLALSLDAAARVTFIGSPTAGSVGESMQVDLPGSLRVALPIVELRRADEGQWQRVGITPSVDARLTVRGIRSGQDDVIDRAQQWILQRLDPPTRRRR